MTEGHVVSEPTNASPEGTRPKWQAPRYPRRWGFTLSGWYAAATSLLIYGALVWLDVNPWVAYLVAFAAMVPAYILFHPIASGRQSAQWRREVSP